jgi:glycerol 3-phosphatase-1
VLKLIIYRIGREIGVDPEVILATSHGRRSIDVLKIYEPKLANWECERPHRYYI